MGRRGIDSATLAQAYYTILEHKHKNPELYRGWPLFLDEANAILGGLGRNWYTVIAAQSGLGKTSFLITLAYTFGLVPDMTYLFIALEESTMEVAERLYSYDTKISRTVFRDIMLTKDDWKKVDEAKDVISLFGGIWSYGANDVNDIKSLIETHDPDLIIIDYIQLMKMAGHKTRTEEVSAISRFLQRLTVPSTGAALETAKSVVAAAQMNDDGKVLWSRDIFRDADVFINIEEFEVNGDPDPTLRKINIQKSRHSGVGSIDAGFNGELSMFRDPHIKIESLDDIVRDYLNEPVSNT